MTDSMDDLRQASAEVSGVKMLSPVAQAVLDAAKEAYWLWDQMCPADAEIIAAAALRAAADEVCLRWQELEHPSDVLNRIAAELEGFPG